MVAVRLVLSWEVVSTLAVPAVLFDSKGSLQVVLAKVVNVPDVENVPNVPPQLACTWNSYAVDAVSEEMFAVVAVVVAVVQVVALIVL